MTLLLLAAITVSAAFEGGALKSHEWVAEDHLVAVIPGQADQDGRNHQPSWFYFSISGIKGRTLTVEVAGFEGEYNYRPHDGRGHRNTRPAFSYDGQQWAHFAEAEWLDSPARLRLKFTARENTIWIARIPPYRLIEINNLLASFLKNPLVRVEEIGRSVEGRPLQVITVKRGNPGRVVWVLARQHAWEAGTSWALEGAVRFLLGGSAEAGRLLDRFSFCFLPTMDPDGLVRGGVRFNRHGYDLNRNWDVDDPVKMPEIAAVKRWMLRQGQKPALFLSLHNTESADFLQGPMTAGGAVVKQVGERLNQALVEGSHFHAPGGVRDYAKEPPAKGRMVADQWVFERFGVPSFLMELMVDTNPKIGRPPGTKDRLEFGAALMRAIGAAL